jgi:hypothetical protein
VVADVPISPKLRDRLVNDEAALEHEPQHDPGWVTVELDTEEGVQRALALLRANYAQGSVDTELGRPQKRPG